MLMATPQRIIPAIRSAVLSGVHILFSSVIPLDTPPQSTEIWRLAYMFGATCHVELVPKVTHVVAAKRGTVKVDTARRQGKTRIVWLAWFTDSVALWRRMDETPYLLDAEENGTKLGAGSNADEVKADVDGDQVSSDHDPDPDDWDDGGLDRGDDVAVDEIDWDDINDEVDAAMNESDDGGEDDDALSDHSASSNGRQGITSEDDGVETKSIVRSVPCLQCGRPFEFIWYSCTTARMRCLEIPESGCGAQHLVTLQLVNNCSARDWDPRCRNEKSL